MIFGQAYRRPAANDISPGFNGHILHCAELQLVHFTGSSLSAPPDTDKLLPQEISGLNRS